MKENYFVTKAVSALVLLILSGCSDNDGEAYATINIRPTVNVSVFIPGIVSNVVSLSLASQNLVYDNGWNGEGDLVFLDLRSPVANTLAAGTYTFGASDNAHRLNAGNLLISFDAERDDFSSKSRAITGGYVIIENASNQNSDIIGASDVVSISYELLVNGESLSGNFQGTVDFLYGS